MHEPRLHPLQRYWDLATSAVQADALRVALELDMFGHLREPACAHALASRLGAHPVNTGHLLAVLWSMGLLVRSRGGGGGEDDQWLYETTDDARRYLVRGAPEYCGDAWLFRLCSLRDFGARLGTYVRQGASDPDSAEGQAADRWAAAARAQLAQEQHAVSAPAALAVLERVPEFGRARRFLDLGGGPGLVAIALAETNPALRGVVFDLPDTVAVARENIATARLDDRLTVLAGDLADGDIGGDYDLIWCSSVLHFVPDVQQALVTVHAALRPGGVLVCVQAEQPESASAAAKVLPYYLPLLMRGLHVTPAGELMAAMKDVGFVVDNAFDVLGFPVAPVRVLVGRKVTE